MADLTPIPARADRKSEAGEAVLSFARLLAREEAIRIHIEQHGLTDNEETRCDLRSILLRSSE